MKRINFPVRRNVPAFRQAGNRLAPFSGQAASSPQTIPGRRAYPACATMMAGSSDSGSAPLMMVMSAGGSRRAQPEIENAGGDAKNKTRPRKKFRGALRKWPSRYFAGVFVGAITGAFVADASGQASKLLVGGRRLRSGRRGSNGGVCICFSCTCFSNSDALPPLCTRVLQITEQQAQAQKIQSPRIW